MWNAFCNHNQTTGSSCHFNIAAREGRMSFKEIFKGFRSFKRKYCNPSLPPLVTSEYQDLENIFLNTGAEYTYI
jgi:hypothetical protein